MFALGMNEVLSVESKCSVIVDGILSKLSCEWEGRLGL